MQIRGLRAHPKATLACGQHSTMLLMGRGKTETLKESKECSVLLLGIFALDFRLKDPYLGKCFALRQGRGMHLAPRL
jgi:hypothetical protein